MAQTNTKRAQVYRTLALHHLQPQTLVILAVAIAQAEYKAKRAGARLGIRLNMMSDISFEDMQIVVDVDLARTLSGVRHIKPGVYRNLMDLFPQVYFYDYTKVITRMRSFQLDPHWPSNYHLTWSLSEYPVNRRMAWDVLTGVAKGRPVLRESTVAMAFDIVTPRKKGVTPLEKLRLRPLPRELTLVESDGSSVTRPVVDADVHDFRPADPPRSWSGLRFKIPKSRRLVGKTQEQKIDAAGNFIISSKVAAIPVVP